MNSSNKWLVIPNANPGARLRLYCFPNAGGGALGFRPWSSKLPPEIEVCAIQLPGRETRAREQPFDRVQPLVQALTNALLPGLSQPFALYGHSMGALIAFELARSLRRFGVKPKHLFVSGRQAPQLPNPEPLIYALPDDAFIAELRHLNGTPASILDNPEMMDLLFPLLRADFAVNEAYTYEEGAPLDVPISAFGGTDDPRASLAGVEAWKTQTSQRYMFRAIEGDHFFVNTAQPVLLQYIMRDLAMTAF